MLRIGGALLAVWLTALSAAAQDTPGAFAGALLKAMASRDRAAVVRMFKYPATAIVGGLSIPIGDRATALELYTLVFTPELRCLIETSAAVADSSGASLAGGRVRAVRDGRALRIARVSVPPADGSAPPPPSPPQRAFFKRGQAQFAGRLYGDGVDAYIVPGRKGWRFEARIEKFSGRRAAVRMVDPQGNVIDRPGADAPRVWAGVMTATGDYRLEVVRLAPYCEAPFTYLLTMTMR